MSVALSPFVSVPLALAAMLIVSAHVTITQSSDAPASRKRIRIVNGWVMLLALPLIAAGVSIVPSQSQPRLFLIVWICVILLLALSIFLAVLDATNTMRLAKIARQRQRVDFLKAQYAPEGDDE